MTYGYVRNNNCRHEGSSAHGPLVRYLSHPAKTTISR